MKTRTGRVRRITLVQMGALPDDAGKRYLATLSAARNPN